MSWLKQHWLGVLSIALTAASFVAGLGIDRLVPGQAPQLALPAEVTAEPGDLVKVPADGNGGNLLWDVQPKLPSFALDSEKALLVSAKAQGVYVVRCETARGSKIARAECKLTVGNVPPGPGPGPGPTPPVPPTPPAPIPADGLHVLIVLESADLSKLTVAQATALTSQAVRAYLNDKCPAGPDGKTKEWRIWSKDTDASAESKLWQDAFAQTKGQTLPAIVVSNPKQGGGFVGPLPADADALLTLLKKFGG